MMNDPLKRLSREEIERRTKRTCLVINNMPGVDIEELKRLMNRTAPVMVVEPSEIEDLNLNWLREELEAAADYIETNEVIHLKTKKDIPTVIEYQGRRYILDVSNRKI